MTLEFTVEQKENGMLLRDFLRKRGVSAALAKGVKASNGFFRDGAPVHTDMRLSAGQRISFALPPEPPTEVLPQALPLDILYEDAHAMVLNKPAGQTVHPTRCKVVCEGANMPSTPEAINVYLENGMLYGPAKAANAGGVATSGLEMSQNSLRLSWTFEEVDERLQNIMKNIFHNAYDASKACGAEGNLMVGANVAGFIKVADAMLAEGIAY